MEKGELYITTSCVIRDNQITRNGALLWETSPEMELPDFLRAAYDHFSGQYPKFHKMDNLCKLGWLATEVLLQDKPLAGYAPEETGLILTNRSASLDTDLKYYSTVKEFPSPALFVYTLPNIVMGEISIRHGFKGENIFFTTDHFDMELITAYAEQLFSENAVSACICGWIEVMNQQYEVILHLVEKDKQTYN
ncbi:hypothetical protein SAMN05518672_104662 [Chitinophaga sp. CF118]|uniref:hypothetical protein n=1 Tax=Chitinophaga sp. CF118 TaxID=1884367 RepID=UPI0008E85422|nr:hypothetical protein [Chitinophaga sp. CF118]SFE14900.1 hypothetical protein SAMN05518672_104662 [Chitinophaga sp. CF118]